MVGRLLIDTSQDYGLSVVPLFILMGLFVNKGGISRELYAVSNAFLGHMRGGLAMATIVACGGFAAISGSSLATAATMSKVAMPEMRKFGYADSLSTASIAAGGTLGILIPPSVILIIYGLLTESDIGDLFIAGLIPGALGVLLYLAAVIVTVRLDPSRAPEVAEVAPMSRRDAVGVLGTLALFAFVMGGIYGGVFTPIEAGGMGALFALVLATLVRGLDWSGFRTAVRETVLATAMIFAIIIGAEIFSTFVNFAGLPMAMVDAIYGLDLSPWLVILAIVAIYLAMGCVFESLSMILLTVPVFYPVVQQLDFGGGLLGNPDHVLIWFAIVVVVVTEISLITPPIGMNVFVMRSVIPDIELATVFRGVFPFWIADLVRLALLIFVPWFSLALL